MHMTVGELMNVLYEDTPVEICYDFKPIFTGTASEAEVSKHTLRKVDEVYINHDGTAIIVSVKKYQSQLETS